MKNTLKRSLAYLLLICMLLTILPLSTFAEGTGVTYDYKKLYDMFVAGGSVSAGGNVKIEGLTCFQKQLLAGETDAYVGILFEDIPSGTYTMEVNIPQVNRNGGANVYIITKDDYTAMAASAADGAALSAAIVAKFATTQMGSIGASGMQTVNVSFTGDSGNDYYVFFKHISSEKLFLRITDLTLRAADASAPLPTIAPTSAATEPSAGDSADRENPVYVGWEVAAENPVSTSYFTHAATSVVNGHDYLYLVTRGDKIIVYDIDDKKQIADLPGSNSRSILVDENGIVWISGATLCRYDPFSGEYETVKTSNLDNTGISVATGMVSDGKGKIYFGSMNYGYIGCYDTATKKLSMVSDWLSIDGHEKDAKHSGYAGIIYKDGYLYLCIDGDQNMDGKFVHSLIKYDIANRKIVDSLDLSAYFGERQYLDYSALVGDTLFLSYIGGGGVPPIDISGKLKFTQLKDMASVGGAVTEVIDGKCYFIGYYGADKTKCAIEFDVATKQSTVIDGDIGVFKLRGNNFVTVEGDDRLPGQSILRPFNDETAGVINLWFWNPQTKEQVIFEANIGLNGGAGSALQAITADPTGKYVYVGAYGNNAVSVYSIEEDKVVESFRTYSHQTDDLMFYNGYLYVGNYGAGCITQVDPQTKETIPLFTLRYTVFDQCRMFSLAAGDNKVFCGTVPYSGLGGVLVWYDYDTKLTYVAAGPNPEDVYYADTSGLTVDSQPQDQKYVWYNAVTGEKADFDDDDDGKDDVYLADGTRRFPGVVPYQVPKSIFYKDGYIYGATTVNGASGTFPEDTTQAVLFVYDVKAMKIVATCDVADYIDGFTDRIPQIDQVAADPDVDGKFWGAVADTLFSYTFDTETKKFTVKEELSINKDQNYSAPGNVWRPRDIIFDGEYMYIGFGRHTGIYMIRKNDPTEYYLINEFSPNLMAMTADGDLYWLTNESSKVPTNLNRFPVGALTAPLVEKAPIDTAQKLIAALDKTISFKDKAAIEAARAAYDKLSDEGKAQITNLDILTAAEAAYAKLPVTTAILIAVAVIAVAGITVAVILIVKKKKKNAPDAE